MENKTEVLIVVDNDMYNGIERGYYDINKNTPSYEIISVDTFYSRNIIAPSPKLDGKDIYIRNPYSVNNFFSIEDDVENLMIENKAYAIREALVMMGAKDITLVEDISDKSTTQTNISGEFGIQGIAEGDVKTQHSDKISLTLKRTIESRDPNRKAHAADEVQKYLLENNLLNDGNLIKLAQRLERDGKIAGEEDVTVTFCSEIKSALNILCNLNYKLFNSNLDFESKKSNIHTITKRLKAIF